MCTSTDPRDRRLRTAACIRVHDAAGTERVILLDAGPDLRAQALREGLVRCDAILFTHHHVDHTFGLDEVRRFNALMGAPIDIYAEAPTLQFLDRVFAHIFQARPGTNESFVASLIPRRIEPGAAVELWGLRFTPFRLLHGRMPVLGFRIERIGGPTGQGQADDVLPLAYCTDLSAVPPESWRYLTGLQTLVLDALRRRRHPTHLSLDEAVAMAERIGAARTWLVHMSHELPHAETDATLPDGIALAWDGLILTERDGSRPGAAPASLSGPAGPTLPAHGQDP